MLSKVDLRDFLEINHGLYGDDASFAAALEFLTALMSAIDARGRSDFALTEERIPG
jgi:hypothetical protein